jgi:hypothetical protein
MEVSSQLHAPAALAPGKKPPIPVGQEAGWAPEPARRESNPGHPIVQLVASGYTDWAIPAV